jgi:hypothetical protein
VKTRIVLPVLALVAAIAPVALAQSTDLQEFDLGSLEEKAVPAQMPIAADVPSNPWLLALPAFALALLVLAAAPAPRIPGRAEPAASPLVPPTTNPPEVSS